jgi:hypothetical protein
MAKLVTALPDAKARARLAHKAARAGDPVASALYDRIYATAVACAGTQPERITVVMFVRAAIALEVLHEMKGWPAGKVAGVTA